MLNGILDKVPLIGGDALDSLLHPMGQAFGELLYYVLISDFIRSEIEVFGFDLLRRVSSLVGVAALTIVTLWILIQGFRIISGQSRDSMMAFVLNVARVALIVAAATSMGVTSGELHKTITVKLLSVITSAVTGNPADTPEKQIDRNLAAMQFAMTSIDAINVAEDPTLDSDKKRALMMVGVGTAGPAMIGGAMLLLYQVAIALFVGLGPLFILCLIFDQTKPLFSKWLMYGISTMFSMAVLAAMIAIATKLILGVAGAFWTLQTLSLLTPFDLKSAMTTIALQQGGVGLLLTVLIVSTPPMAANFFNGTIGGFLSSAQVGTSVSQQGQAGANANYGRAGGNPVEQRRNQATENSSYESTSPPPIQGMANPTRSYGSQQPAPNQGSRGVASSNYMVPPPAPKDGPST